MAAAGTRSTTLAAIPQINRLMESDRARALCDRYRREDVVNAVRMEVAQARIAILDGAVMPPEHFNDRLFARVDTVLAQARQPRLVRVINATGVVLHTNLGRAPLAPEALAFAQEIAAGYSNLEIDLDDGERGSRYAHVEALLCRLTGAEAALVVNNCAAAVLLSLMALAQGGEVLVSRGELIEIGGSFRMPDVIAQSGARLVEVGATNKTRLSDYADAIHEGTRMILKSHPSNYRIVGFSAQPERSALAQLAQQHGLAFVEDLGSGTLVDLRAYGLPHEPTVQECLQAGAGIVTFSGDKLLGGPQAGILVGMREHIDKLKKHPLLRALRIDKLSLATLEATLRLYEMPSPPERHVPVLRMLAEPEPVIRRRAKRLLAAFRKIDGIDAWSESGVSYAGGGSLPQTELPTCVVKLRAQQHSSDQLARALRQQQPALVGRIANDAFVIDLRTVAPGEVREIAALVGKVVA